MKQFRLLFQLTGALFIVLVGVAGYNFHRLLKDPEVRREIFLREVTELFRPDQAEVSVDFVGPLVGGEFSIRGFGVRDRQAGATEFIEVGECRVRTGGFLDPLRVESIEFSGTTLSIQIDDGGGWNFHRLIDFERLASTGALGETRPTIQFLRSTVELRDLDHLDPGTAHRIEVENLRFTPWGGAEEEDGHGAHPHYDIYAEFIDPLLGAGRVLDEDRSTGEVVSHWDFARRRPDRCLPRPLARRSGPGDR